MSKKIDRYLIEFHPNQMWMKGEVFKNGVSHAKINQHYEVDKDFIYIYDTTGSSGSGFRKGSLLQKINITNSELEIKEINDQ